MLKAAKLPALVPTGLMLEIVPRARWRGISIMETALSFLETHTHYAKPCRVASGGKTLSMMLDARTILMTHEAGLEAEDPSSSSWLECPSLLEQPDYRYSLLMLVQSIKKHCLVADL